MTGARSIGSTAHDMIVGMIEASPDDATRKERIMIARQEGILTDQEASDWLAILELRAA